MKRRLGSSQRARFVPLLFVVAITLCIGFLAAEAAVIEGIQTNNSQQAALHRDNPRVRPVIEIQNRYTPGLLALRDVVGTATGLDDAGNPAVVVFAKGPGALGIPARLEGVPVAVKVTGEFHALKPGRPGGTKISTTAVFTPPVPIGVSTGNEGECSAGTIGARLTDGTDYYALSNNHVFVSENNASLESQVLQPGLYDTQCIASGNVIGRLANFVPINFNGGDNKVDAAIAIVYADSKGGFMVGKATPSNGYGTPDSATADAALDLSVMKYGRTTQQTAGTITGLNATITVNYGASGNATFVNQIIVQSAKPFLKAGDSGSLLVTSAGLSPVGLLFAGDSSGKYAIANRIQDVLSGLDPTGLLRVDGN